MPLATRFKRLIGWDGGLIAANRHLRITVHVFEARSTGVLPLTLPPLNADAVSHVGDRMVELIRETAKYYDGLNTLYAAAQFKLISAEEGFLQISADWRKAPPVPLQTLSIQAGDYTVHVSPALLDESNWLTTQIIVDHQGKFLLGNRLEKVADDKPIVISGPVDLQDKDNEHKAVFVGVIMRFVSASTVEQARPRTFETQASDRPPYLVTLGEIVTPNTLEEDEMEGMVIYLTHIGDVGQIMEVDLVLSLRSDYDASALEVIRQAQFVPAAQGNEAVDSWMFIPVQFVSSRKMPVVSAPSGIE